MLQTQTLILAIGGFQGFLLFALLVTDKRVSYASKLLSVQCLLLASTFMLPLIVAAEDSRLTWLIGPLVFLPACYGALTYLYCRSAITGTPLSYRDLVHATPLALCYLLNYDLLTSADLASSFVKMPDSPLLKHSITKAIFYGQAIVYAALLIQMIARYQTKANKNLSSYNPDIFKWLWSLTAFVVSIWGLKVLSYFMSLPSRVNILADALLVLMVYFIAVMQWRNPSLFHIQQLATQAPEQGGAELASTTSMPKQGSDGLLDQETRACLHALVQDQVKEQALYRDSELTLATLADQVGVSVHHLSEALNQYGGKNFNLFINEYRVAEVCQQLGDQNEGKLIDLALDAGFSSKSTFNAIFKKITGLTPSVYRNQLLEKG